MSDHWLVVARHVLLEVAGVLERPVAVVADVRLARVPVVYPIRKGRLQDAVEVAALDVARHVALLALVLQQVLLEVAGVAVGALADVTLVKASATAGVWK